MTLDVRLTWTLESKRIAQLTKFDAIPLFQKNKLIAVKVKKLKLKSSLMIFKVLQINDIVG